MTVQEQRGDRAKPSTRDIWVGVRYGYLLSISPQDPLPLHYWVGGQLRGLGSLPTQSDYLSVTRTPLPRSLHY